MRTGGGYTYFKRDRPVEPRPDKHPLHWHSEDDDPNAYVYYDGKCAKDFASVLSRYMPSVSMMSAVFR